MTAELMVGAGVGVLALLSALGQYLKVRRSGAQPAPPPTQEQTERISKSLDRMAVALETIADKRQSEMHDTLHAIAEKLTKG
ncbi:hypothetical protein [Pseudohoeflea coraliihabitans]|uniref:Uncharacterized protein n=1 Tax=Pseudohoeflea coraliihabitans TaxID=2860393 RepID=A0ABS6WTB9_9HYPH|nr:hypothetical protein [Pseudohoeflea sp. DP4N28-3]MBW3099203.1 hypothetical protein [Pseudohoeflea sp. DP4N28-3]